jgi:predicted permease
VAGIVRAATAVGIGIAEGISEVPDMLADLRLALRGLWRDRGMAVVAVLSLMIGIAANTTVFSLVQAVEFPVLIYPDSGRLVFLESSNPTRGLVGMPVSAPDARDIAASSQTLIKASVAMDVSMVHRAGEATRRLAGRRVEPAFFEVMGTAPAQGCLLRADDAADHVVVAHHIGMRDTLNLDGRSYAVVGVMPAAFDADADFWIPWVDAAPSLPRDDRQFMVFARLAPVAAVQDAARELGVISAALAASHPSTNTGWVTTAVPLAQLHGRDSRGTFRLLQGVVGVVLLIACANIANLLLARGTRRRQEMAVRISLGATRRRLVRQLLAESLLLSAIGCAGGVLLSLWGIRLAQVIGGFPDAIVPHIGPLVLAFSVTLSVFTGIITGIVPALMASQTAPELVLRSEGGRHLSASSGRTRQALVAVQIASALVLATGSGLMVQTIVQRRHVDVGFTTRGATRADVQLDPTRYATPAARAQATTAIVEQLAAQPDVSAVGAVVWALPTGAGTQRALTLPAAPGTRLPDSVRRGVEAITPGYLDAMGIPLIDGRGFDARDQSGALATALVDASLAARMWPDQRAVGQTLRLGDVNEAAPVVTVIGVVGSIRRSVMHDSPVARVYLPLHQYPDASVQLVVRGRDRTPDVRTLQGAVTHVDATLFADNVRSLEEDSAQFLAPTRMVTLLLSGLATTGLWLAALGVFGTMSYAVSQRAPELAVRAALGAAPGTLGRLVLAGGWRLTLAGVIPGVGLSIATTHLLQGFLYGVSARDPLTVVSAVALIVCVSLAACGVPAIRAARVDPMTVLRRG